jgi:hypothetical protein
MDDFSPGTEVLRAAIAEFRAAAAGTANLREQQYLTTKAARLARDPAGG